VCVALSSIVGSRLQLDVVSVWFEVSVGTRRRGCECEWLDGVFRGAVRTPSFADDTTQLLQAPYECRPGAPDPTDHRNPIPVSSDSRGYDPR